jgi:hypothetical protein
MVSWQAARALAVSLPEAVVRDQMGSPSFCVNGKIFAQLSPPRKEKQYALVKLPAAEQAALVKSDPDLFSPVPGYWGTKGWTYVQLAGIDRARLRDLFLESWRRLAQKRMDNKPGGKGFTGSAKKPRKKQMRDSSR